MRTMRWLVPSIAALAVVAAIAHAQQENPPRERPRTATEIQPEADRVLRQMSESMSRLRSFRVSTEFALEVVTHEGQRLQFVGSSNVAVRRPNRLRVDRRGARTDMSMYYDGRTLTLHGRRENVFATTAAPSTLDQTIDFTRERLDIEAPAGDLLYSDPYEALTQDVTSGTYVGEAEIDGVRCHHIAYRGREVDWQLWVEANDRALPRRYVIVSKQVTGQPEFSVELSDWVVDADVPDAQFTFVPPAGEQQIEFLALRNARERAGARAQNDSRRNNQSRR